MGFSNYPNALPRDSILNGRYVIRDVLGQGGFGITYKALYYQTNEYVAIKEYYPRTLVTRNSSHIVLPQSCQNDSDFECGKTQFLEEARTLSEFVDNQAVVKVHSYFEENGTAYFVMEYLEGVSFSGYLKKKGGRISWTEAWNRLVPLMDALSSIHEKNIVHRDIKPDNIIITKDGSTKLLDFGAARYVYGVQSHSLEAILTPGFAPMEQYFRRGHQGPWTDVYALAATMYCAITGTAPHEAVERLYKDTLIPPSALGITLPDFAETAILKALAVHEENRYRNMSEFKSAVLSDIHGEEDEKEKKEQKEEIRRQEKEKKEEEKEGKKEEEKEGKKKQKESLAGSWEDVLTAIGDGKYRDKYRIGDIKALDLGKEGTISMQLVAMDADDLSYGSGKASMTWIAAELIHSGHPMNPTGSNMGGWPKSDMRAWLRESILPLFPDILRSNIKEVTKYSFSYSDKGKISSNDKIWIPSVREVLGADAYDDRGPQYTSFFRDDASRQKRHIGASGPSWWWLRSASYGRGDRFYCAGDGGDIWYGRNAPVEGGVAIGFCL